MESAAINPFTNFETSNYSSLTVSDEEFNSFHSIDRLLYTMLITNLGRDPKESMQIMGFWLWLEREVVDDLTLVKKMLALPVTLVKELSDETVMCLRCVESDVFPFPQESKQELVYLRNFVQRDISYKYFYENRIAVVRGIAKMVAEVCSRAFRDILEKSTRGTGFFPVTSLGLSKITPVTLTTTTTHQQKSGGAVNVVPLLPPVKPNGTGEVAAFGSGAVVEVGSGSNNAVVGQAVVGQPVMVMHENPYPGYEYWYPYYAMQAAVAGGGVVAADGSAFVSNAVPPVQGLLWDALFPATYAVPTEKQDFDPEDFSHVFRSSLSLLEEDDDDASPDERTIFLTFSKGYPITASEVKEFFTKKFGDFIETIQMQDVGKEEQVLFARVVARSTAFVNAVVEGGRAKYNINGKHVWARKYVKKQKSPPPPDATPAAAPSSYMQFQWTPIA